MKAAESGIRAAKKKNKICCTHPPPKSHIPLAMELSVAEVHICCMETVKKII